MGQVSARTHLRTHAWCILYFIHDTRPKSGMQSPTYPFTISKPQNPSINEHYEVSKSRSSVDCDAINLWKGRSVEKLTSTVRQFREQGKKSPHSTSITSLSSRWTARASVEVVVWARSLFLTLDNSTDPFTNLELQNSSHEVSELLTLGWSPDFEALKLWKGRSGEGGRQAAAVYRQLLYG